MVHRDAIFPEEMLRNFTQGCRIPRGPEFPVTPERSTVRPCFPLFSTTKALSKVLCLIRPLALHAFYRMPLYSAVASRF